MAEPIVATYGQDEDDWVITVSGHGKELTARAPGIIAARDRTDQLVEQLGPSARSATVVHLLNGSALEFTEMYMKARLTRSEPSADEGKPAAARAPQSKSERRLKAKLTTDIGDALATRTPAAAPEPAVAPVATAPATPAAVAEAGAPTA
ncbi:hypothetical protein [Amycolatopsis pigmentata]|uniref:Lsr2 protein n=1 Tax=Amycolatopsis pigmentata TaxID=450801 RepID=A0ABW5FYZ4_9PSEU